MTLPKKNTRKIVVQGQVYLWHHVFWHSSWIVVQHSAHRGQLLCLNPYHPNSPFGPGIVAKAIVFATDNGWNPEIKASPMRLGYGSRGFIVLPDTIPKLKGQFNGATLKAFAIVPGDTLVMQVQIAVGDESADQQIVLIDASGLYLHKLKQYLFDMGNIPIGTDRLTKFEYHPGRGQNPGSISLLIGINEYETVEVNCRGLIISDLTIRA